MKLLIVALLVVMLTACNSSDSQTTSLENTELYNQYTSWLIEHFPEKVPELHLSDEELVKFYKDWLIDNDEESRAIFSKNNTEKYTFFTNWLIEYFPEKVPELHLSQNELKSHYKEWLVQHDDESGKYLSEDDEVRFVAFSSWLIENHPQRLAQLIPEHAENWPTRIFRTEFIELSKARVAQYHEERNNPEPYMREPYYSLGDYLNHSIMNQCRVIEDVRRFDSNGVVQNKFRGEWVYNPVTMSQCALGYMGRYIKNADEAALASAIAHADKLVDIQDSRGAYPYDFKWTYYLTKETYEPGWTSSMAQGQVMSLLARVYSVTKDRKYLDSGNRSLEYLKLRVEDGGVQSDLSYLDPSLKDYIFFEEYISIPYSYTLNGYMFTQLGIFDWWYLGIEYGNDSSFTDQDREYSQLAKRYFQESMRSLERILPYFDIGGMSAYDLGYITHGPDRLPHTASRYHRVHLYLLNALYSITASQSLLATEIAWSSYVDFENVHLGNVNEEVMEQLGAN